MPDLKIYFGPAGWSYKDWYGNVYPEKPGKAFKELDFLATFLNTVEINSTFYRPANGFMGAAWIRKVAHNPDFIFTAKLWNLFTHKRADFTAEDVKNYNQGIDPLYQAGKLGAILLQFPWSFKNSENERQWLNRLIDTFKPYPLVVELRHASWDSPETLKLLNDQNVGLATIDQPVIGDSIKPKPVRTGQIGYVRLHGRNYNSWFPKKGSNQKNNASARYDYLYSKDEIKEWADKIKVVSQGAEMTFVIQNNHPNGQAVCNTLELVAEFSEAVVYAPSTLIESYPQLKEITKPLE